MPIDDLLDLLGIESGHRRQHPHRAVEILGVLADDRDGEGVAIVDEHLAVAVEQHPARGPQRERPLMVVLRHLLVLRVLGDLQYPETDRERREQQDPPNLKGHEPRADASAIFCYCHKRSLKESGIRNRESVGFRLEACQL